MLRRSFFRMAKDVAKGGEKAAAKPEGAAAAAVLQAPKMLSNGDVGGPTTWEIQKDMTENEIKEWERKWINENLPMQTQRALNRYYTATQAPGFNGGSWRFDVCWMWHWDHLYAPWHTQQYLIGAGRNPGGWPFWGIVEWIKIMVYEGWRLRRNMWRVTMGVLVTFIAVEFRDCYWDPVKDHGVEGHIKRRKDGRWLNYNGFPGFFG